MSEGLREKIKQIILERPSPKLGADRILQLKEMQEMVEKAEKWDRLEESNNYSKYREWETKVQKYESYKDIIEHYKDQTDRISELEKELASVAWKWNDAEKELAEAREEIERLKEKAN